MKSIRNWVTATVVAVVVSTVVTVPASAETVFYGTHDSTSGSYIDFMKTVYARAGKPEILSVSLTSFDKEYELHGLAAESWSQSDDGLTWTFKIREGLLWSDGKPVTAHDFEFALKRAATNGYDFAWYWSFAGGIKNWGSVTRGEMNVSEIGVHAPDVNTLVVKTETVKSYLPAVVSLWYPVPQHAWEVHGDEYAANVDTIVTSGPFHVESWEKSTNRMVLVKSPTYNGPWQAQIDKLILDPTLGPPEVGFPGYLAGEADMTSINVGQIPFAEQRYPDEIRRNAIFAISYISFDLEAAPFDNLDVRKAFWYAIDRDEMTATVLKGLAIPARSLLAPGFPGYNESLTDHAIFDRDKAREHLAAAGYPNGDGFPKIEIWYRDQGGYNGAITPPMLQYLQAEFKEHLNIEMGIQVMPISDWMDALLTKKNGMFLAPYEFDYLDPSNFYGIFFNGGRHDHRVEAYDQLIAAADSTRDWEKRLELYEQAEMVMIDNASIVPLVHPVTTSLVKPTVKGDGATNNKLGFAPLDNRGHYFFTHVTK